MATQEDLVKEIDTIKNYFENDLPKILENIKKNHIISKQETQAALETDMLGAIILSNSQTVRLRKLALALGLSEEMIGE